MEVLLRSLTRLANHLGLVVMLLKLTNIRSSNFSAPLRIKISTRPERKKERVKERNEDLKKDKNIDDHEIDDDDKARELNYDLEINIYFDNAFEKRSTAPKWNGKTWEAFDHKKHGYNYYANDKDIQGWDRTIIIMEFLGKFSDKKLSQEKEWKVCNPFVKQLSDLLKKVLSG